MTMVYRRAFRGILRAISAVGIVGHLVALSAAHADDWPSEPVSDRFAVLATAESSPDSADPPLAPQTRVTPNRVGRGSNERLIDRTTDPTAWLLDLRLRQQWNWPVEPSDADSQSIQLRPTIPFMAWDQVNILRVSVSFDTENVDGSGLDDVQIFNLTVYEEYWGRWGIGPSFRLKPASGSDDGKFLAGPAAGAVTKDRHWTIGVLTQNFLGDDDSETRIQPILAYKFDEQWALNVGESEFRYDWDDSQWVQIPLGLQLEYIADVYGQKIQLFVNPQYNFQNDSSNSGWTLFLGFTFLVPEA